MSLDHTPFVETICRLRANEEIVVFRKQFETKVSEESEVVFFLETEYENEATDYPFTAPAFHPGAALWAAKIVYFGAQLLLFRQETANNLDTLFPNFKDSKSEGAQLSADLCLRFLPSILHKLREIDPDDLLIAKMEALLLEFPYSGIGYFGEPDKLRVEDYFLKNDCCAMLLANRVIEKQDRNAAADPVVKLLIESAMGNHQQLFWPSLKL
jgi:hypothetical protein